jgi:hypothetical protein
VLLREGDAGYVAPFKVLVVLQITSFLPSVWGLEFLFFDECTGALLQSQWGGVGLCSMGGKPSTTIRVAGSHPVEELRCQLLDRRDMALLQRDSV